MPKSDGNSTRYENSERSVLADSIVPSFLEELGTRINEVSLSVGGVKELSHMTGISESQMRRYIAGTSEATASKLLAIAKAGDVSMDWLATGDEPRRRGESVLKQSTVQPFDMARFKLALETVEEGLRVTGREMASDKKAELVAAVYDLFAEDTGEKNKERILRLVKSAA